MTREVHVRVELAGGGRRERLRECQPTMTAFQAPAGGPLGWTRRRRPRFAGTAERSTAFGSGGNVPVVCRVAASCVWRPRLCKECRIRSEPPSSRLKRLFESDTLYIQADGTPSNPSNPFVDSPTHVAHWCARRPQTTFACFSQSGVGQLPITKELIFAGRG